MVTKQHVSKAEREKMIAEAAYFLAVERGFETGDRVDDWLRAERAVDARFDVTPHDEKLAKLYEQLSLANEKVRELGKKVKSEAREEWDEELTRIKKLRDSFSEKLDEAREHTGEAKDRAKRQADKLWHDIVEGIKAIGANLT